MAEPEPQWLTPEEQEAWRAYLRASRELDVAMDRDLQEHGISFSEYEIVSMLSEAPDQAMRMSSLADLVVQSRSRVTHTASRLEKRGWVERRPAPEDGRGVLLVLTDAGRADLDRFARIHLASVRRHLIDVLPRAQFIALGAVMQRVRDEIATVSGRIPPTEPADS